MLFVSLTLVAIAQFMQGRPEWGWVVIIATVALHAWLWWQDCKEYDWDEENDN